MEDDPAHGMGLEPDDLPTQTVLRCYETTGGAAAGPGPVAAATSSRHREEAPPQAPPPGARPAPCPAPRAGIGPARVKAQGARAALGLLIRVGSAPFVLARPQGCPALCLPLWSVPLGSVRPRSAPLRALRLALPSFRSARFGHALRCAAGCGRAPGSRRRLGPLRRR